MNPVKKHKKDKSDKKRDDKQSKVNTTEDNESGGLSLDDYVINTDVDAMINDAESGGELVRHDTIIVSDGDNVFMVLPGTKKTEGKTIVSRMIHGLKTPCARAKRTDRFEMCAMCEYWFANRSTKEEREAGKGTAADDLRPKDIGVTQLIEITWACEHEMVRKEGDEKVSVLASTDIDPKRVKKCECFLDLKTLNPESDKCKKCIAFKSCFQGPRFLNLSPPRVKDMLTEQQRIGGKKKVEIKGKTIKLRGNISLGWHVLHGDKDVAKRVSYPFIYTKVRDPKKDKRIGTSYKASFARDPFVLPIEWQKRALERARDISKFLLPITRSESIKALNLFLKSSEKDKKMDCFDNKEIKDSEHCIGEACANYDECCQKKNKKDKDGDKKDKKNKGDRRETKQEKAIRDMSEEDEDVDSVINRMNSVLDDED